MRKNFGAKPFLYPQPVMILGTYDENGKANAMNAAWGGIVGANEIIVDLSAHKTTDNIIKNKAFTVGVADLEHLVACDYVGIVSANKEADKMKILAFESSCDETAVAVVEDGRRVLSDAIASQADMHALYGGVVPEIASRKHVEAIAALTDKALADAGVTKRDIDAVAVTYAPGLIGAVLVGLSFAKSVAYALGVPLIPVHHIRGHIAANYLAFPELEPPFLALCMSGGNTLLVDVRDYTDLVLGGAGLYPRGVR